jgi:hypothetical protein
MTQPAQVRAFLYLSFLTTPQRYQSKHKRVNLEPAQQQHLNMLHGK